MRLYNITICLFLCVFFYTEAQKSFTGKIEFMYYRKDTTRNVYIVNDQNVRLDQYSKKNDGSIEGSFLFDLGKKEIKILSPKRKIWSIHKSTVPPNLEGEYVVTKTSNTRKILNILCDEYVVSNKKKDRVITYYITSSGNYKFFIPMMELWNRKDNQSVFFGQIKNLPHGSMPFLSIEKELSSGRIISQLEVIKITNEKINPDIFIIPKDYKKFEEQE